MQFSFAQQKTVTGVVTDDLGPVVGANVLVKGTKLGTATDFDGKFTISAKEGEVLVISYAGATQEVVVGAANTYNVFLKAVVLVETVVQGYRSVTKKSAVTSVASVDSKTIENRPNANAMNTIQGQLAGVNITASTGQPGARSQVIIRGLGTITGNSDPLYVIDGFPSNSDNFRSINSNDIESITVLKDASALAEYGNRASNGVVVIKTKRAAIGKGKTTFRYSTQYGVGFLQNSGYDFANARQLLKIEQNFGAGLGSTLTDAEIAAWDINTDWVGFFLRPTTTNDHTLSIENSGENVSSFTSLGYLNNGGILESTSLQRFTLRNNITGKSTNDKFNYTIATGLGFSKNNEATALGTGGINNNFILGSFLGAPYVSPDVYVDGESALDYFNNTPGLLATPIMLMDLKENYDFSVQETRIDVATEFSYKLFKDLTLTSRVNGQLLENRTVQTQFPDSFNALLFSSTPGVTQANGGNFNGFEDINYRREFFFNNLWQINYNKEIKEHTFNLNANAEYTHSRVETNNFRQRGLINGVFVPGTGAGYAADTGTNDFFVPQISALSLRNDLISYFGSFDYDYKKKYGFVASVRYDGTSRFIGDQQWGTFGSIGARWNIDEESFMDSATFIDVLKLRGSYGTVGNQRIVDGTAFAGINPPAFTDIYSVANNVYNGQTGYGISFGYPALKWETTAQWNVGLDFEMFKGRLRGVFDYYNRETTDQFLDNPVTPTSGTTNLTRNSDVVVTNSGLELNLAYDLIKKNDMTLTLRANGAKNKNEVSGIKTNNGQLFTADGLFVTQNGGMINEPFVYKYLGVNPVNGNLLFEDANGNPTENPVQADRRAAGVNRLPVYQGGFGFDFSYKGFFASTLFTYAFDVSRFDFDEESLYDTGSIGQFVVSSDMLNAWTPTNTNTDVPSLGATNLGLDDLSDRFLRDASYVRLRNVQVGYNVPPKFLDKTFIKSLRFTLQGENLLTFTRWNGFDVESTRSFDNGQYPTPRLFTFGADIKF